MCRFTSIFIYSQTCLYSSSLLLHLTIYKYEAVSSLVTYCGKILGLLFSPSKRTLLCEEQTHIIYQHGYLGSFIWCYLKYQLIKSITHDNLKTWPLLRKYSPHYESEAPFGMYTALMGRTTEIYLYVQHSFINSTCMKVLRDTKHSMRTHYKQKAICNVT